MTEFEDIRPYRDDEVRRVLDRLAGDREFADTLLSFKYPVITRLAPWLLRPFVRRALQRRFAAIDSVADLQDLIGVQMRNLLQRISSTMTTSGIEHLEKDQAYLFISNHRDIAMDPAFVNLALHENGMNTVRIAIGDNLLTKPFASDLMRVNKSFIVKRSATGRREKLEALSTLSRYIRHSICRDHASIWIAQREGRAKNGLDRTEPALIKMLSLSKPKEQSFAAAIEKLRIVPVAVSYEWDPCDRDKARELHARASLGDYQKGAHEDLRAIYKGIVGHKGRVHVAFGTELRGGMDTPEQVAAAIDRQVIANYLLQPTNFIAYEMLHGQREEVDSWRSGLDCNWQEARVAFAKRLESVPQGEKEFVLSMYANPVISRLEYPVQGPS